MVWGEEDEEEDEEDEEVAACAGRVWFMYSRMKEKAPKLRQPCANA